MRHWGFRAWALGLAVATALTVAPAYRAVAADDADIAGKIAAAKTAADHEAIAAWYEGQAAELRAKVETHKKMGADYRKLPHNSKAHLDKHCTDLEREYTAAAKENDALAKAHHDMAKQAK